MAHPLPVKHTHTAVEWPAAGSPPQAGSVAQRVLSWEGQAWTSRADCRYCGWVPSTTHLLGSTWKPVGFSGGSCPGSTQTLETPVHQCLTTSTLPPHVSLTQSTNWPR